MVLSLLMRNMITIHTISILKRLLVGINNNENYWKQSITLNAEKDISRAINSLKEICDEIIVLDSQSDDATREIAESAGVKVHIQPFLGDGGQKRSFKIHQIIGYSVLDADEYLDRDLIEFVKKINFDKSHYDSYSFRRKNFCGSE